jgi:phospholipase/carboxylesterase
MFRRTLTRRGFLSAAGALAALPLAPTIGCAAAADADHLKARPPAGKIPVVPVEPGEHVLGLGGERDGVLYVPKGFDPKRSTPLAVVLHGAGRSAQNMAYTFPIADELGLLVITPDSRGRTWDVLLGGFGPDVEFIDRALEYAFARCTVDPSRLAIAGFSDGGSYALSLGLTNGDLFSHTIAFSPGFIARGTNRGKTRIFVSHGTQDQVLPIDMTSHRLVPALKSAGYVVKYHEFEGPHRVPPEIAREAYEWLTVKV